MSLAWPRAVIPETRKTPNPSRPKKLRTRAKRKQLRAKKSSEQAPSEKESKDDSTESNPEATDDKEADSSTEKDGFVLTDMRGREVSIPGDPQRFVCIGPGCLRLYCYVGDKAQLVGVEEAEKSWGEVGRTYRLAIDNIDDYPSIGPGGPGNAPDAEMLFNAEADVIFTCYDMELAKIDELQGKINTPIVALSYGEASLFSEEVDESLRLIGKVTGRSGRAEEVVKYLTDAKADLEARSADVKDRPGVYLGCMSNRGSHGIESTTGDYPMFDALKAENVVAKAGIHEYVLFDKEKLLDMDPEVIVIDAGGLTILQDDYAANPDFYNSLSAVKNGKLYLQMPFNFYSTNIDIALADAYYIGTVLYPE
ncbi:MAG: ABC transporter substrate-binding protein [Eubacteriales bacterium]|nr:ABC transporter substrate-binding protein [Eubacteriales bacterium]